ncbi:peptidylprolyl isomerase [Paenibacillus spiritus]|uniref:peptidylprolyl isomerase n=1 Tax=Paenibacillus spiritus TaxID=2496557 RepID=A0A5J5G891_9BACL|nr:SurA N-terminal domain-containing protein [Paenibacillus spiritus]KAA9003617.1 peptidylprolyl isomerase [Paenibacillus spiritus]
MTRQERALRKAVAALSVVALLLGALLGREWMRSGQKEPDGGGNQVVARVAGTGITQAEWQNELRRRYGSEVLLSMVNRIAVEQEAQRLGVEVSEAEVDQELRQTAAGYGSEEQYYQQMKSELGLTREEVRSDTRYRLLLQAVATSGIVVSDQEIEDYLQENADRFRPKWQIELSLIKLDDYAAAEDVLNRLDRGEDFETLARELSTDPDSRQNGGRMGTIEEDDPFWPKELLKTALTLNPGDMAGPLALDDGFAVIRTDHITVPKTLGDEEIRRQIRQELALEQAPALADAEAELRKKYGADLTVDKDDQD